MSDYNVGWLRDENNQIFIPFTYSQSVKIDDNGNTVQKELTAINDELTKIKNGNTHAGIADSTKGTLTIGKTTFNGSTDATITAKDLGITGALVYRGVSSTEITDGGTELPKINENYVPLTDLNPGNIVLYKANNSSIYQEFVWTNSAWELLGDEGSYALKTLKLIAGDGIKINNGTNSTLTQDITIKVIPGAGLIIDANGKIAHSNNIQADTASGSNGGVNFNESFNIPTITYDAQGHITGKGTTSITLPDVSGINQAITNNENKINKIIDNIEGNSNEWEWNTNPRIVNLETRTKYFDASEEWDTFWVVDKDGNACLKSNQDGTVSFDFITDNGASLENIAATYIDSVSASGTAPLSLNATKSGTSVSITGSISAATQSAAGTLSAADKKKLDGISEDSNKVEYSQTQTSGTKIGTITIDGTPTNIYVPTLSGGEAEKADTNVISGVTVDDHTVTVAKKSINGSDGISTSGTIDAITIKHNTKGGTDVVTTAGKAVTSLTIDDYGHVTATGTSNIINSVTVSGTGNAITGGSVTNGAVTLTKGASFDTAGSANAALTSAKSYTDNAKTEVMTGIENIQTSLNQNLGSFKNELDQADKELADDLSNLTDRTADLEIRTKWMGLNTSNGEDDDSFFIVDANGNKAMQVDENGVTSFDFITDNGSSLEALASKLSNITDSADAVSYSQTQTSGTKIGAITINGSTTNIYVPNLSGGKGETADTSVVSGVTVNKHAVTVANKNISGNKGITTSGTADTITISHNTTGGTDVTTTAGKAVTSLTIDDYGHVTATGTGNIINSITISGTGNAITGGSVTNGAATLTKGATFKTKQTAVSSPTASSTAVAFIDTISQDTNGVITATKKTVRTMGAASSSAAGSTGLVPAPAAGNQNKYLRGDGTWQNILPTNATEKWLLSANSSAQPIWKNPAEITVGNADYAQKAASLDGNRKINGTVFNNTQDITTAKWGTGRTIEIKDYDGTNAGTVTNADTNSSASINGAYNIKIRLPSIIKGTFKGNADTATKVNNALTINGKTYNGSSAINVGAIGPAYGGTGKTSLQDSANALINALSTNDSTPVDADYYVSQSVKGGTTTTTYHRRPMSTLYSYVQGKADSRYLKLSGDTLTGTLTISNTGARTIYNNGTESIWCGCNTDGTSWGLYNITEKKYIIRLNDGKVKSGYPIYGAVWNDYAEFRKYKDSNEIPYGKIVIENGDDSLSLSTKRLQKGGNVCSDTFGFAIGETEETKMPIAVSGRALVYTNEDRNSYEPGDAVCTGPNGTISKMTREEIKEYPDCIIGYVSAVPQYDTWGEANIKVDNRIWIKVV